MPPSLLTCPFFAPFLNPFFLLLSGGLLVSLPSEEADAYIDELRVQGYAQASVRCSPFLSDCLFARLFARWLARSLACCYCNAVTRAALLAILLPFYLFIGRSDHRRSG